MIQPIVFLASIAGVVLALMAVLEEETGVTGTAGAWLAVLGSGSALFGLAMLRTIRMGRGTFWLVAVLAVLAAGLAAVAAWFLMQDVLTMVMAVVCIGILFVAGRPRSRRNSRRRTFVR